MKCFLFLVDMLFTYLSCPTTTSFQAICEASYLTASACKNKIVVVVVVAHMQLTSSVHIKYHESVTCFDVISIRTLQGPNLDTSNTFLK